MKWRVYLCSALFAFLGLFVGSVIINQNSVFAVDDVIYNPGSYQALTLCSEDSTPKCSDYSYLLIDFHSNFNYSATLPIVFINSNNYSFQPSLFNHFFYSIPVVRLDGDDLYSIRLSASGNNDKVTLTLSNSYGFGIIPSGSLSIVENGTFDVTNYAEAVVNVPPEIIQGDYHDDLVSINKSILICGSVCLIIYFFYCIYRMLLRGRI